MAADDGKPDDLASFRAMQAGLAAARLAIPVDRTAALIEACVYGELEDSFGHVPLYPGVRDCLESLRGAGLPLAVLSDFPVSKKLEALGLSAFFPIGRTSEECGRLKPAARPFLSLAKELGLEPQEILYVGNNRHFDIIGANAAGMETALRTSRFRSARLQASERKRDGNRGRAVDLSLPTFSFHRYEDLCSWILTQTMSRR